MASKAWGILHSMENRTLQPYFLLAVLGGSFVLAFFILQPFLAPLALAIIFAVVLQPIYRDLAKRFGGRTSLASLATVVLFALLVLVPLSFIGVQLVDQASGLYTSISSGDAQKTVDTLIATIAQTVSGIVPDAEARAEELSANVGTYASSALNWIVQHFGAAFSGVLSIVLNILVFFVALYYLLRDGKDLAAKIIDLSPLSDVDDSIILGKLSVAVNSVIKGQIAIALIQGALSGIGLAIFGVPNPVLWGFVTAMAALIPTVGTGAVLIPAIAYLAFTGSLGSAIGLTVWAVAAVGLIDNLLGPKLISAGLQLHPLLVLLAVIGGIILFGPVGIFLGPLTMSLLIVLLSLYKETAGRGAQ